MNKFNTKTNTLLHDLLKDCESPEDILGKTWVTQRVNQTSC